MDQPALLITGSSSGIGRACTLRMAQEGFYVYAGVRKEQDFQELKKLGRDNIQPVYLDVTRQDDIEHVRKLIHQERNHRGLQGLVNNSGISIIGPIEILPVEKFREQFEVNFFGVISVTQAFIPLLRAGKGRIVNMGSIAGQSAMPYTGAYCASKFALRSMNDSLRIEMRPWKIPVSIIEPGAIQTSIWTRSKQNAEETLSHLDEENLSLYQKPLDVLRQSVNKIERNSLPSKKVVNAVYHALTAKKPKPRYTIGRDAKLRYILEILPYWVRDRILFRYFHTD